MNTRGALYEVSYTIGFIIGAGLLLLGLAMVVLWLLEVITR